MTKHILETKLVKEPSEGFCLVCSEWTNEAVVLKKPDDNKTGDGWILNLHHDCVDELIEALKSAKPAQKNEKIE